MKIFLLSIILVLICSLQISCTGNECSATANFITDIDSDCVDDASDNCVGWDNVDQFDGDEDGVGAACDADDTDDTNVATVRGTLMDENPTDDDGTYEQNR